MPNIPQNFLTNLTDFLRSIPALDEETNRDSLLSGLPRSITDHIERSRAQSTDLENIVQEFSESGRITAGEFRGAHPLEVVLRHTRRYVADTEKELTLNDLIDELCSHIELPLPELEKLNLDFTNRQEEIRAIISDYAPAYYLVDGPAGYGKSQLLKEGLKPRFEESGWRCALAQIQEGDTLQGVAKELAEELGVELSQDRELSYGQRLGGALRREQWGEEEGVVLLLDLNGRPNLQILKELVESFIPDIHNTLKHCEFFSSRHNPFRAVIAARSVTSLPAIISSAVPFGSLTLRAFDYGIVLDSAYNYLGNDTRESVSRLAAHLIYLTGGHPGCIATVLALYKSYYWAPTDVLSRRIRIWRGIIRDVTDKICDEMPSSATELEELVSELCVFRCLDYQLLERFAKEVSCTAVKDSVSLADRLTATYIFDWSDDNRLIRDNITRRLLAIRLQQQRPGRFISLCGDAQEFCFDQLVERGDGAEIWLVEYLFQILQQQLGSIHDPRIRDQLREEFWNTAVPTALKAYFGREQAKPHYFERVPLVRRIEQDWEFCFTVNYYLRRDTYNDETYLRLLQEIEEFSIEE